MSDDETELAPSLTPTEHAHAWSVDNWADNTLPYLDTRQRTTTTAPKSSSGDGPDWSCQR
jgi:hypothetical protein